MLFLSGSTTVPRAQALADTLSPDRLHPVPWIGMPNGAVRYPTCSGQSYHRSLTQVEYVTDLAFRSATTLKPLYEQLVRESVLSVKAEQVATFHGRQITPLLAQAIGSQSSTRIGEEAIYSPLPTAMEIAPSLRSSQ